MAETEIELDKIDIKNSWEQIKQHLPVYSLFQSDRKNSDGDSEIQNPMKLAVQEILKDQKLLDNLNEVACEVEEKLKQVASRTLDKLNEMNPEIADTLSPVIPSPDSLKWIDVFKSVSITGDENIPINKRGSGVKRLVLLNFFRAEAERRSIQSDSADIIYAIEEPETSQHPEHQRKLIEAFIELSKSENTQVILTTHSPQIVKMLEFDHLKLIKSEPARELIDVEQNELPYPSLNEVNFLAFGEADEEYHNELYGFIESEQWLPDFKYGKDTVKYIRVKRNGDLQPEQKVISEYIRHQIHHPENTHNTRYTQEQLQSSINDMRSFIQDQGVQDKQMDTKENEIICPHCDTAFKIDEAGYADIVKQVRDTEFDKQLDERLTLAEKDKLKEVELAKSTVRNEMQEKTAVKDAEIKELKAKLDAGEVTRKLAVTEALKAVESERDKLANELEKAKQKSKDALKLAEEKLSSKEAEQKLAITEAVSDIQKERDELKNSLKQAELKKQLSENSLRDKYKTQLKDRDDAIERLRDMKARLSTKMVGETLEQHCETEFNRIRATAFPNAYFEKDNDTSSGSKGDFIFRDSDDAGTEIVSIIF